jgi:hypothetical protein
MGVGKMKKVIISIVFVLLFVIPITANAASADVLQQIKKLEAEYSKQQAKYTLYVNKASKQLDIILDDGYTPSEIAQARKNLVIYRKIFLSIAEKLDDLRLQIWELKFQNGLIE